MNRCLLIAGAAVLLAGCASVDSQLQAADAKCSQTGAMTLFMTCLNSAEEPVWQSQPPDQLEDYKLFAGERMGLAQDLDSGKITAAQFAAGAQMARATFRGHLEQDARKQMRSREAEAAQQNAVDTLQQMQKAMPSPESSGMVMGNGMDMGM